MFQVDDELKEFFESGVAVLVGTVDAAGHPRLSYAWGPRVHPDGQRLSVYVERPRSAPLLTGGPQQIAVTFTEPVSARSIQVKGHILEVADSNEAEAAWVSRHRDAMTVSTSLIGDPPAIIRNLWMDGDLVRIDVTIERAFDQTPGPNAGQPLATPSGGAS